MMVWTHRKILLKSVTVKRPGENPDNYSNNDGLYLVYIFGGWSVEFDWVGLVWVYCGFDYIFSKNKQGRNMDRF